MEIDEYSQILSDFLSHIRFERGLAENTAVSYESDLAQFFEHLKFHDIPAPQVKNTQIKSYITNLTVLGLKRSSVERKLASIKRLYRFLALTNDRLQDPTDGLRFRNKTKRLPVYLSQEESFRLCESARGDTHESVRDRAILELLWATGMRISELASLTVQSIDLWEGVVVVRGKGNRERLCVINKEAISWCEKYQQIRHKFSADCARGAVFFLTKRGTGFTRQGLWKLVKRYARLAGIEKTISPHSLRHTFATHLVQNGADLRVVQSLLGHKSILSTQLYTHLDIAHLEFTQLKFHPR